MNVFGLTWNSGLYDMTMLRFAPEQRVGYREYMRSDGTRSYFFSLESLRDLFSSVGFIEVCIFIAYTLPRRLFYLPMKPIILHAGGLVNYRSKILKQEIIYERMVSCDFS